MKTILISLLTLACFNLPGQSFTEDELIIEYESETNPADQYAVRSLYGITDFIEINEGVELWRNIPFPITFTEGGHNIEINDIEQLQDYIIEVQNNGQSTTTTANINNGTFNFTAQLIDSGTISDDGTFDPLPYCPDIHNNRLIGINQSNSLLQNRIKIVIIDQAVSEINNVTLASSPLNIGGNHGNKVYSTINNILTQAGITDVDYYSLVLFDDQGQSSIASLTEAFFYFERQFATGEWNAETDRIIVNLSANVVFPNETNLPDQIGSLSSPWETCIGAKEGLGHWPIILVNSAGNQSSNSNSIFPAAFGFTSEISVAGTENCFSEPWENTNHNPVGYEIAAEAESVLTEDNGLYYLSDGTSYSSAIMTAVAAQIALNRITDDIGTIREYILNAVDHVPALNGTVQDGRVVNIENHPWYFDTNTGGSSPGQFLQSADTSSPLSLQTTPNPFSQNARISIGVPVGEDAEVSLYNSIGQMVHQERIPNQQELKELEWITPNHLPKGTYFVRVQAGDQQAQQMIVKQ